MATIEVEEDVAELGKLALKLSQGKNRKDFLKLVSSEYPDKPKPAELAAEDLVASATEPLKKQVEDLNEKLAARERMDKLQESRKPVAHLSPEELKRLDQFRVDKGILDYEIAYREMKRLDQVATPRPVGRFGRAEMPQLENKDLYKDPAGYRSKTLHGLIDDLRAGKTI